MGAMKNIDDISYTPNRLLNHVRDTLGLKSNWALARHLRVDDAAISRVSNKHQYVTNKIIIAILDAMPEMTLSELRKMAGQPVGKGFK